MFSMKSRIACILITMITVVAALAAIPAANSRVLPRKTTRSAIVSGWIIFVGGPHRTPAERHRSGTVYIRTDDGHNVTHVHATAKHGYRVRLVPGQYELRAIVVNLKETTMFRGKTVPGGGRPTYVEYSCGLEPKVTFHAGANPPVDLSMGCDIP